MDKVIGILGVIILGLVVLVIIMVVTAKNVEEGKTSIFNEADKRILCNKWMTANPSCDILDPTYEEDLAKAGICEPCPKPAGLTDLKEIKKQMIQNCYVNDDQYAKCIEVCGCSYAKMSLPSVTLSRLIHTTTSTSSSTTVPTTTTTSSTTTTTSATTTTT